MPALAGQEAVSSITTESSALIVPQSFNPQSICSYYMLPYDTDKKPSATQVRTDAIKNPTEISNFSNDPHFTLRFSHLENGYSLIHIIHVTAAG